MLAHLIIKYRFYPLGWKAFYDKNVSRLKGQIHRLNERLDVRERSIERKDAIMEKLLNAYLLKETTDNDEI